VVAVFVSEENSAALSVVHKTMKAFKQQEKSSSLQFLGGWYDKKWKSAEYVSELATMPSREELLGKFLYLLNSPLQRFAFLADQIAVKK
jgi:ribosomal protein L10